MKSIAEQDYYETLDLSRGALAEEIERAYRLALSTYSEDSLAGYPVFEAGDVALLRERIELAYRTLKDPERRSGYDAELDAKRGAEPAAPPADDLAITFDSEPPQPAGPLAEPLAGLELVDDREGEWAGARLRRSRLSQGFEIQQISDVTKINPTYLHFIEEERFEALPAAVYVRGFVMGFAGCLGLDAKRVAASYLQRYEEGRGGGRRRLFSRK